MTKNLSIARPVFENRRDAGRQLARELSRYEGKPVIVFAIPNGGVPVGLEVASALKSDFDLIICRKIPIPFNPEAGFGAIADDGTIILNDEMVRRFNLTEAQIDYEATKVRAEIKRRSMLYRGDRPLATVTGKTVIVIDDGLASGFTMMAAIVSLRRHHPRELIAAVPVASKIAYDEVSKVADKVVTCVIGEMARFAVADFYRNWRDLKKEEVVRALDKWRMEQRLM